MPKKLPVPGFNKTITFEELLTGDKDHGDKVVFFGGGQSACEAAYELVLQGKHPIIVEYANDLIATPGTCLANASFLREMLVFKKVPIYLEHSICEIGDGYVMVKPRSGGDAFKVECDSVVNGLASVPRRSRLRASMSARSAPPRSGATCATLSGAHGMSA